MQSSVMVVPLGSFTPQVSQRVCAAAIASSQECPVVISMHNADEYSWSALSMLAAMLRETRTRYAIRVAYERPRTRALLDVFGIENLWHVREIFANDGRRIMIA